MTIAITDNDYDDSNGHEHQRITTTNENTMNGSANDIISSGILDLYVAGALSQEEISDVERLIVTEPEVAAEVQRLQRTLEQYARLHSTKPRPELRSRVLNAVADAQRAEQPALTHVEGTHQPRATSHEPRATERVQRQPAQRSWLLAASVAFLLGLMPGVFYYLQYNGIKNELTQTQIELADAKSAQGVMASKASYMENAMDKLADTNVVRVMMPGLAIAKSSFATVWWNKGTQEVMIDMRKMPDCPAGHDYQLWAIVDGKPVDLGVFNPKSTDEMLLKMSAVGQPQLFAVTLEPIGGSPSPTLEKMVVAGPVTKS